MPPLPPSSSSSPLPLPFLLLGFPRQPPLPPSLLLLVPLHLPPTLARLPLPPSSSSASSASLLLQPAFSSLPPPCRPQAASLLLQPADRSLPPPPVFMFTYPSKSPSQHDLKRRRLLQILPPPVSVAKSTARSVPSRPLLSMLSSNLPPLPPPPSKFFSSSSAIDVEIPALAFSPYWPHPTSSTTFSPHADTKSHPSFFDHLFLLNLLALFRTEDPREHDRLTPSLLQDKIMSKRIAFR